jgi:hypothetical protein
MRLSVSSTPSNTPSNTPSVTPSSSSCPFPTPTNTPSVTATMPEACPEQITINTTTTSLLQYNGTYNRLYANYTGGTFNYVYLGPGATAWYYDTADTTGYYGIAYGRYSGGIYYTIYCQSQGIPHNINVYGISTGNTSYNIGLIPSQTGPALDSAPFDIINNIKLPSRGLDLNNFYVSYPALCPTSTPTPTSTSVTPTSTPTNTPTPTTSGPPPTSTPTSTPTPTTTQANCECWRFQNETNQSHDITFTDCGDTEQTISMPGGQILYRCLEAGSTITSASITYTPCLNPIGCTTGSQCNNCGF